jgi:hypothetical protein
MEIAILVSWVIVRIQNNMFKIIKHSSFCIACVQKCLLLLLLLLFVLAPLSQEIAQGTYIRLILMSSKYFPSLGARMVKGKVFEIQKDLDLKLSYFLLS